MGKFAKFCLIAAAIMISLGIFIGTIVTAVGGRHVIRSVASEGVVNIGPNGMNFWDWSFGWPWSWNWGNWNSWGNNARSGSDSWNSIDLTVNGSKASGRSYEAMIKEADINSLNITVGVGEFKVIPWEKDYIQIEINGRGKCNYYSQGKTLYVEGFDLSGWNTVNANTNENKLKLYVPEGIAYDRIKVDVGVGALDMKDLTVDDLNTDSGVGSLKMDDMVVNRLNITNSIGETIFKGEVNGDIIANCSIGSISLRVKGEYEDFDYAINCALGSISVGKNSYAALANESKISNGAVKKMTLDCSIGNIDVRFY